MGRASSLQRNATWLVLVACLTAGTAFVVARASLPSDGGRAPFYGATWTASGITIAPIDAPSAGLQAGDTVAAVDGRSMADWVSAVLDPAVRRPATGAPIAYALVRQDTSMVVDVAWSTPALGAALLEGWGIVLFSIATAVVAGFTFRRRPGEPAATALVLVAAGASGSSVPWFLGTTTSAVVQGWPFLLHAVVTGPVYMLMWPATLHLALAFPRGGAFLARRGAVAALYAFVLGAYALITVARMAVAPSALEAIGSWPGSQVLVVVPCLVAALLLIVRTWAGTDDPAARAKIRLATAGAVASVVLGLVLFMGPILVIGHPLVPEGALGLLALPLPLGIAAGILHDRLFDIDAALNRTMVYGGLSLGVVAVYTATVSVVGALAANATGFSATLLATGLAALVALPLRDVLQRAVNRLMYGMRYEPLAAIRLLGRQLEWAADPEGALPAIAGSVQEAFRVPYVAVEVDRADEGPVIASETGVRPADTVAVPLGQGAQRVGTLVLGCRPGEQGFRPDERRLLDDLARQAGTAITALGLRADLERSRERLVLAREEERRRLRRDLHDGLGPALAAIGLRAETAAALLRTDADEAEASLDALGGDVRAALADIRRLVEGLRPPALDELGLVGAIRQQAERLETAGTQSRALRITVDGPLPDAMPEMPAAVEVAAYRIVIEALTNAVRHASAETCGVRIGVGEGLEVEVVDDGAGLRADAPPGVGLESMRVRAAEVGGELRLEPHLPRGTRVVATLPIRAAGRHGAMT